MSLKFGFVLTVLLLVSCSPNYSSSKSIQKLAGTTWFKTDENVNVITLVSFIDSKIAYIIKNDEVEILEEASRSISNSLNKWSDEWEKFLNSYNSYSEKFTYYMKDIDFSTAWEKIGYPEYENINVGTLTITGKNGSREWQFTYTMDNGKLNLTMPDKLNPNKYGTIFSKRIVGVHESQPIGIWANDNGSFFFFTNSEVIKKWGFGVYISWDYTADANYITWSGNKDGGKKPYQIVKDTGEMLITLPGDTTPVILKLASNKFNILF